MSVITEQLLKQALVLPALERATLVDELLSSLDRADPEILKLWAQEAERRVELFDSGKMESFSEDEVFSELEHSES